MNRLKLFHYVLLLLFFSTKGVRADADLSIYVKNANTEMPIQCTIITLPNFSTGETYTDSTDTNGFCLFSNIFTNVKQITSNTSN